MVYMGKNSMVGPASPQVFFIYKDLFSYEKVNYVFNIL